MIKTADGVEYVDGMELWRIEDDWSDFEVLRVSYPFCSICCMYSSEKAATLAVVQRLQELAKEWEERYQKLEDESETVISRDVLEQAIVDAVDNAVSRYKAIIKERLLKGE